MSLALIPNKPMLVPVPLKSRDFSIARESSPVHPRPRSNVK